MNITDTFTHDGRIYDLGAVRVRMRTEPMFLIDIKKLLWVLDYDKPDEDRVIRAKHRYPLLVARWNGKWTVVDGLHRLEKYRRRGVKMIPVKLVTDPILARSLIAEK